jgi:plasmid stabilization system protein ParE
MKYVVKALPIALEDGNRIYQWIAQRSMPGAIDWYTALLACTEGLQNDPRRFALAPEQNLGVEVRQRLFKTRHGKKYRMVFTIIGNEVKVLRIRGPGQPPLKRKDLPKQF